LINDIVIVVDDVVANNVENLKMKLTDKDGDYLTVSPKYHPGSFMVIQSQYEKMMSEDVKSIEITFSITVQSGGPSIQRTTDIGAYQGDQPLALHQRPHDLEGLYQIVENLHPLS